MSHTTTRFTPTAEHLPRPLANPHSLKPIFGFAEIQETAQRRRAHGESVALPSFTRPDGTHSVANLEVDHNGLCSVPWAVCQLSEAIAAAAAGQSVAHAARRPELYSELINLEQEKVLSQLIAAMAELRVLRGETALKEPEKLAEEVNDYCLMLLCFL